MITILLIEDNREIRENTCEILELSNYNVTTAENGLIGLELAKKIIPDIIISDIMMPELNGYEVLEGVRTTPSTEHIPFIFFTAKSESMDMEKGLRLGANDYLIKPFDDEELLNTIEKFIKRSI
jgi:CheY-like chemotaxis protein